ncbi:protein SRG1-like [Amaranthus tricolor]|uniref:protein SRG1-like n=1 Tax=Amaranthus tricolor TaxID=29722 RepID=UPI00258B98BB|nr:protein SRG1-like [Amaranthus tricolor]
MEANSVQEIAKICNNKETLEKFMYKNGYPESKTECVPLMENVIIDLSLLSSSSSSLQVDQEFSKLRSALTQWGCFQVINHGMTNEFLDKVREVTKQFFALPLEEKQNYSREMKQKDEKAINDWDGYGNDPVVYQHQTLDWMDRLLLTVNPEHQRKLQFWPRNPLPFREIIDEYALKVRTIFEFLLKATARSLNLEENCFLKEHGDLVTIFARFNYYPPCPIPENVLGQKPHSDTGTMTLLLQDEVEGLQVLKDNQWFRVPVVPQAIFVNIADRLEIMSNGMVKSAVHRVVTNSERERITVVMFCSPDYEREIGPIITDDKPPMYKKVVHYENLFFENYQFGKRALDTIRF